MPQIIFEMITTMSKVVESRDSYTSGHQESVAVICKILSEKLGFSREEIKWIEACGLLHDIGKITIPPEILSKPDKLTPLEFTLIKGHAYEGYKILRSVDFKYPIDEIVYQHHERVDGSGYPQRLNGDQILFPAKIIAVADVVDAMLSNRPYRNALTSETVLKELHSCKNSFDKEVLDAYLDSHDMIYEMILSKNKEFLEKQVTLLKEKNELT